MILDKLVFDPLISVTKKLRPHWSKKIDTRIMVENSYFRNEKVTAPLKLCTTDKIETHEISISVTKKLRPHWSIPAYYQAHDYEGNFRNEKVTAPLKRTLQACMSQVFMFISVTKKLRPHWSNVVGLKLNDKPQISVTKKLRPHWSEEKSHIVSLLCIDFRNEKVTAPLKHLRGLLKSHSFQTFP